MKFVSKTIFLETEEVRIMYSYDFLISRKEFVPFFVLIWCLERLVGESNVLKNVVHLTTIYLTRNIMFGTQTRHTKNGALRGPPNT